MRTKKALGARQLSVILIAVLGGAMVCAALAPIDPVPSYPPSSGVVPPSLRTMVHNVAGVTVSATLAALCAVGFLTRRRRGARSPTDGHPAMAVLAAGCATVAAGASVVCSAIVTATGGVNWDAAYAGMFQRLTILAGAVWIIALAVETGRASRSALAASH